MHIVRRAIADLAAAVAKQAMPRSEWPELLGVLHEWSQVNEVQPGALGNVQSRPIWMCVTARDEYERFAVCIWGLCCMHNCANFFQRSLFSAVLPVLPACRISMLAALTAEFN